MRASVLQVASIVMLRAGKKSWVQHVCGLYRDAHRRLRCWMHPCSSQTVNDQLQ